MKLVPLGEPLPDCPGEDYRSGISMIVMLAKFGLHDFSTTASGVLGAVDKLHDDVLAAPETAEGKVPQVKISRWIKEKTKKGTRAVPEFVIVDWKPRPEELKKLAVRPRSGSPKGGAGEASQPPSTGSTPIKSPTAPHPAEETEDEWG
jgi:hypothetical protein